MDIIALPLLADNYAWLLINPATRDCAVLDPSEGEQVAQAILQRELRLRCILATHHHPDHIDGIPHLAGPGVEVIASRYDKDRIPYVTQAVDDLEHVNIVGQDVTCMAVPGHTLGAVAYHFTAAQAVFTGDTLFLGGCGRLFEGTPAHMHASLQRLSSLPPQTQVCCGHEYTQKNLEFAATIQPQSDAILQRLADVKRLRQQNKPTVPAKLSEELRTNPFLRASEPHIIKHFGAHDPLDAFAKMRQARNTFA